MKKTTLLACVSAIALLVSANAFAAGDNNDNNDGNSVAVAGTTATTNDNTNNTTTTSGDTTTTSGDTKEGGVIAADAITTGAVDVAIDSNNTDQSQQYQNANLSDNTNNSTVDNTNNTNNSNSSSTDNSNSSTTKEGGVVAADEITTGDIAVDSNNTDDNSTDNSNNSTNTATNTTTNTTTVGAVDNSDNSKSGSLIVADDISTGDVSVDLSETDNTNNADNSSTDNRVDNTNNTNNANNSVDDNSSDVGASSFNGTGAVTSTTLGGTVAGTTATFNLSSDGVINGNAVTGFDGAAGISALNQNVGSNAVTQQSITVSTGDIAVGAGL